MKLNRQIVRFVGAAAVISGISGMGVGISRPAQAEMAQKSYVAMTANANNVPTSVSQVGEYGENIYEAAQANNWIQATTKLNSLKDAAKRLDNESKISENPNEDKLDGAIAALEKAVVNCSKLQNTSTSLVQLTPFQIVSLAYSGAFQKQGIPSYGALRQAVAGGQITAKDLVQSAVKAHKLSVENLTNQGYIEAVENQLYRLAPSAPEF